MIGGNVVTDPKRTISDRAASEAILGKRKKRYATQEGCFSKQFLRVRILCAVLSERM